MKINKTLTALVAGASLGMSGQAFAAGTAAETLILNSVTLDFKVDSVDQTQQSANVDFMVDNKVDFSVSWEQNALVTAVPGEQNVVLKYKINNDGNFTQDFLLSISESATSTVLPYQDASGNNEDLIDSEATYVYYLDDGDDVQEIGGEDIVITSVEDLAVDSSAVIWLTIDIPAAAVDLDKIGILLNVAAADNTGSILTESTGDKNDAANLDVIAMVVFAESESTTGAADQYDGKYTALSGVDIVTAKLVLSKDVIVKEDPINGITDPRAIPGATVTYTITVENQGRADATDVQVIDDLSSITTLDTTNVTDIDAVDDLIIEIDGSPATQDIDAMSQSKIDLTFNTLEGSINGSETLTIKFDATIE